jgi:hypothetical protein
MSPFTDAVLLMTMRSPGLRPERISTCSGLRRRRYVSDEVETTALHDIDLHVAAGEFLAIMGPSGCGLSDVQDVALHGRGVADDDALAGIEAGEDFDLFGISIQRRYVSDEVETTALHDIDLHVAAGEFLAIMGPLWNTKPSVSARNFASSFSPIAARSRSPNMYRPPVGRSSPTRWRRPRCTISTCMWRRASSWPSWGRLGAASRVKALEHEAQRLGAELRQLLFAHRGQVAVAEHVPLTS